MKLRTGSHGPIVGRLKASSVGTFDLIACYCELRLKRAPFPTAPLQMGGMGGMGGFPGAGAGMAAGGNDDDDGEGASCLQ